MKQMRKPRFWLLTTAALIFGLQMSASAQTSNVFQPGAYQAGAPTMVAAAPSLPNIPADQIARDVTAEFNPRTGRTELIAAPFDPFEEDPYMAGALRLRSADGAVAINGQPLHNGALVDIDFYYNSPSDDPYGGRNYSEVSFVSGELAPVVLRDARILECSTRVENVAYFHDSYYSPVTSSRIGIYQPYRHYAGHSAFGFGFGSSYFGPGISFFNTNRSRINRNRSRNLTRSFLPRTNTPNAGLRATPARRARGVSPNRVRGTAARARAVETNREIGSAAARQSAVNRSSRERRDIQNRIGRSGRRLNADDFRSREDQAARRASRIESRQTARSTPTLSRVTPAITSSQSNAVANRRANTPDRAGTNSSQTRQSRGRGQARNTGTQRSIPKQRAAPTRSAPKQTAPKQTAPKRTAPKASTAKRSSPKRSTTSSRSTTKRATRSSRSANSGRSTNSSRRTSASAIRSRLNFFPSSRHGGSHVVAAASVDCAREDKLSVFIPNERLDAASYDGLTIIALDAQGGTTPIYIPPNYIQGYRLAATGRVQPQGIIRAPQSQHLPQIQQQRPLIEPAPCPAGTQKQPNGTCLQANQTGYPVR